MFTYLVEAGHLIPRDADCRGCICGYIAIGRSIRERLDYLLHVKCIVAGDDGLTRMGEMSMNDTDAGQTSKDSESHECNVTSKDELGVLNGRLIALNE